MECMQVKTIGGIVAEVIGRICMIVVLSATFFLLAKYVFASYIHYTLLMTFLVCVTFVLQSKYYSSNSASKNKPDYNDSFRGVSYHNTETEPPITDEANVANASGEALDNVWKTDEDAGKKLSSDPGNSLLSKGCTKAQSSKPHEEKNDSSPDECLLNQQQLSDYQEINSDPYFDEAFATDLSEKEWYEDDLAPDR